MKVKNKKPAKSKKIFYNFVTEETEEIDEIIMPESSLVRKEKSAAVRKGLLALASEIRLNFDNVQTNKLS